MNASVEVYFNGQLSYTTAFRTLADAKCFHNLLERMGFFSILIY